MRKELDYFKLRERTFDRETINYIGLIHEYKGRQELYLEQKPEELDRLIELSKIQSTESSNEIEGIVTTNRRFVQLMKDKTTPKNRSEKEIKSLQIRCTGRSSICGNPAAIRQNPQPRR